LSKKPLFSAVGFNTTEGKKSSVTSLQYKKIIGLPSEFKVIPRVKNQKTTNIIIIKIKIMKIRIIKYYCL